MIYQTFEWFEQFELKFSHLFHIIQGGFRQVHLFPIRPKDGDG
jgi:hypothetical protein